jgi:glycosyltransferase involved in cell wall biosynthesis
VVLKDIAAPSLAAEKDSRPFRVVWVHNTENAGAMFLTDVRDGLPASIAVEEVLVPLRPTVPSSRRSIEEIRAAARSARVVHAQFGSLVGFLASFVKLRPFVLSLRGTDLYVLPSVGLRSRLESRLRQLFTFVGCARADVIVVMSARMRRDIRRWPFMKRKQVVVITDPVGAEFTREGSAARDLKRGKPLRVFVGSLSDSNPVKRTWLVEDAVELCKSIGLPITLQIVSGVPRSTVREVLQASDVVALTSTHEGWPNVVKEGMACGLPFIATDVSDLADLCGAGSPNRIVEPNELDIALAFVDVMARRHFEGDQANVYPETVGIKHELVYNFAGRRS